MLTTLWIIFWNILRICVEIIVFIPRYIFIERHDTRSVVWGSRAEAIVSFPFSSWAHDVVRRIDCLRCLKRAPVDAPCLSSTTTFIPSTRARRITLAEVSDEESDSAEVPPPPEKPTTVVRHLSRWIQGTTTQLLRTERDNLFPSDKNNNNNSHHHHHEDKNNSNNGRVPIISMDEDEDDTNGDDICSAAAMVCPHALQGVFTTGVSVSLHSRHTRAVPISRTRPCLPAKGFVPPFYAVDAKAQLLMALIDPLARIASELFVRTGIAARVQELRRFRLRAAAASAKDSAAHLPHEECSHSHGHSHSYSHSHSPSPSYSYCHSPRGEEAAAAAAGPQATRVASVRWLTAPPPADGAAPAVVLLLCPSVAHGGAAGRVARRVAALCAALSAVAAVRREALSPRHRPHSTGQSGHSEQCGQSGHSEQKATAEPPLPRDARLATWHAAVPAVELRRGAAASFPKGPAAESAAVSAADVDRIIAHLRARLNAVAVVPAERSSPALLPATRAPTADDIISFTGTEESAEAHKATDADRAGHTEPRSVYIVGVGWSNASGPLLQYVIAYGAHARMDGLISIGHTLSSNYGLLHDTQTHAHAHEHTHNTAAATGGPDKTQRMPGIACDAHNTAEAQRGTDALALPFTRALLHERSGTVRLLLLAARLEMIADSLQSANRAGLKDAPSSCTRMLLPAAIVKSVTTEDKPKRETEDKPKRETEDKPKRETEDKPKRETEAAPESHNMRLRRRATFHASLTPSLLSSVPSSPPHDFLNALAHADARADREVNRWWLDAAGSPRSPLTSANRMSLGARRSTCPMPMPMPMPMPNFMSVPIPIATAASPHGEWDTLFSPPSRDDMSWSLVTGATAGRENFAAPVSEVFEMARGMSVSHTALAGMEGAALRAAATAAQGGTGTGTGGGQRISKIELQYRSTQSARVIGCIRVPTLFLHALDDATAPLSTLPMEALATNPKIFTVLTRRGGHGVYLEGVADFFAMPRLTQRPQSTATQREKWKAKAVQMWRGARTTVEATTSAEDDDNEVKTQLVIEGTTWVERLIVEFVSSAILSSPPRS